MGSVIDLFVVEFIVHGLEGLRSRGANVMQHKCADLEAYMYIYEYSQQRERERERESVCVCVSSIQGMSSRRVAYNPTYTFGSQ